MTSKKNFLKRIKTAAPLMHWIVRGDAASAKEVRIMMRTPAQRGYAQDQDWFEPVQRPLSEDFKLAVKSIVNRPLDPGKDVRIGLLTQQENELCSMDSIRVAMMLSLVEDDEILEPWLEMLMEESFKKTGDKEDESLKMTLLCARTVEDRVNPLVINPQDRTLSIQNLNPSQRGSILYLAGALGLKDWTSLILKSLPNKRIEDFAGSDKISYPAWLGWMGKEDLLREWVDLHIISQESFSWSEKIVLCAQKKIKYWHDILQQSFSEEKLLKQTQFLKYKGLNEIFWSMSNGIHTVKYLLKAGLDINRQDQEKTTSPILENIVLKNWKMVKFLCDNGANPFLEHRFGKNTTTPFWQFLKSSIDSDEGRLATDSIFLAAKNDLDPSSKTWVGFYNCVCNNPNGLYQLKCLMDPIDERWGKKWYFKIPEGGYSPISLAFAPGKEKHVELLEGHGLSLLDFMEEREETNSWKAMKYGRIGFALACWAPEALDVWLKRASKEEIRELSKVEGGNNPSGDHVSKACKELWFDAHRPSNHTWRSDDNIWGAALRGVNPLESTKILLQYPEFTRSVYEKNGSREETAVDLAMKNGECEGVLELILKTVGAPKWDKETSYPILAKWFISSMKKEEIENVLKDKLLDVDYVIDYQYNNLLHFAAYQKDPWILRQALKAGVDETHKNYQGETPLTILVRNKWNEGLEIWEEFFPSGPMVGEEKDLVPQMGVMSFKL